MGKHMLDPKDKLILKEIQNDATLSIAELAEKVNLTVSPCWKRLKKLEEDGIILRRVGIVCPEKLGLHLTAFVSLKTKHLNEEQNKKFVDTLVNFDEVITFYRISGEFDYIVKVIVKDMKSFDTFFKQLTNNLEGLLNITSFFAMEKFKDTTKLPLE